MNEHDELEQQLWELEYGLLPDSDATALRQRIAAEPDLAALHQRVCAQSAILAEASRVDVPRILLQRTIPLNQATEPAASADQSQKVRLDYRKFVNWSIAVAASLLLGLLGFAAVRNERVPLQPVVFVTEKSPSPSPPRTADAVKIEVDGPRELQLGISNQFNFQTWSSDGIPQAAELKVKLEDKEGNIKLFKEVSTDNFGRGSLVMPKEVVAEVSKMKVAEAEGDVGSFAVPLTTAPETYVTYLTTDRPRYQLGDTVRFRSVTLSKFGLQADREVDVFYEITDPTGNSVPDASKSGMTTKGVGNGEFQVDEHYAGGQYTVVAQNSANLFPPARRDFYVQADQTRQWNVDVTWQDTQYDPGANPKAKVVVRTLDGKPASDLPIRSEAFVDGHKVEIADAPVRTNQQGEVELSLKLPEQIADGEGTLHVAPGNEEFKIERIPIRVPKILVDFYPEGGDLVADLSSRVYFHAHDALGKPVAIRGRIVDTNDGEVATLATQHEGRGVFRLTPQARQAYSLQITEPAQTTAEAYFPPMEQGRIVLDCGKGVFGANESVTPRLYSKLPPPENLIVVAKCRDAMVGHVTLSSADFTDGSFNVPLQLAAEAAGVIRITVFERDEPVAERLIFRQPSSRLSVQIEGTAKSYAPASTVQLGLSCVNEKGTPEAAVLGVNVVDDAILKLARPPIPRMATHFWLFGDVASPEKLEDANFYVADSVESRTALDLLLGTKGWRRFERVAGNRFALGDLPIQNGYAMGGAKAAGKKSLATDFSDQQAEGYRLDVSLYDRTADLPFRFDNTASLEQAGQQQLEIDAVAAQLTVAADPLQRSPSPAVQRNLWMATITAALVVMAYSLIALFLRLASNRRLAIAGAIVGAVTLGLATFSSFSEMRPSVGIETATRGPTAEPAPDRSASTATVEAIKETMDEDAASGRKLSENIPPAPASQPTLPALEPAAPAAIEAKKEVTETVPPPPEPAAGAAAPPAAKAIAPEPLAAKPGQGGGEGRGGFSGRSSASADAPPPGPRGALTTSESVAAPRDRAAMKYRYTQPAETESTRREGAAADAVRQQSEVNRLRRLEQDLESPQRHRSMVKLHDEVAPSLNKPAAPAADDKLLAKDKADAFFVRRFAYQRSPNQPADKKIADYTETLYWNPLLITDSNGKAEITFDLSDSATTYRVLVDGHNNGRVVSVSDEIKSEPKK